MLLLKSKDVTEYYKENIKRKLANCRKHNKANQLIQMKRSKKRSKILIDEFKKKNFDVIGKKKWLCFLEYLNEAAKCRIECECGIKSMTYLQFNGNQKAAYALARLRARISMEKFLLKHFVLCYRNQLPNYYIKETNATLTRYVPYLEENKEQITFHTSFKITHYVPELGDYQSTITTNILEKYPETARGFNDVIKSFLKGEQSEEVFKKKLDLEESEIVEELQTNFKMLVQLVFFIESKRNPSSLLTSAMFFDLVAANKYQITKMHKILPMAMKDAVGASDYIHQNVLKEEPWFDYRQEKTTASLTASMELAKRECDVLKKWLFTKHKIKRKG